MKKFSPVLAGFFGVGMMLLLWVTDTPEAGAERLKFIRESPAWLFYGFVALASAPAFITIWILTHQKRWSRIATANSVQNAKKMALSLWQVSKEHSSLGEKDGWVFVEFRHFSFGNWTVLVLVRPGHPDVEQFRSLQKGDTVEFEALSQGMDCALEHELCGFLRIKSVS